MRPAPKRRRSPKQPLIDGEMGFVAGWPKTLAMKLAVAGGLLQFGAGNFDEKEDRLIQAPRHAKRTARHDHTGAAMPRAAMIEGKPEARGSLRLVASDLIERGSTRRKPG